MKENGDLVATIAKSGPVFTTSNVRTYDVWGGIRTGATTGGSKGRNVANIGHVQDKDLLETMLEKWLAYANC